MKSIFSLVTIFVLTVLLVGCASDAPTNASIADQAAALKKASEGKPNAPPVEGLQQMSGGSGAAPTTAKRGIAGK